jgi:hypothetical protein
MMMLAIFDQLSEMADVSVDISKMKLRSHIMKMIAKIPAGKRQPASGCKNVSETE